MKPKALLHSYCHLLYLPDEWREEERKRDEKRRGWIKKSARKEKTHKRNSWVAKIHSQSILTVAFEVQT